MRVAVLSDTLLPTPTVGGHGLGAMVVFQCEQLIALGHQVTLYAAHGSPPTNTYTSPLITLVTPPDALANHDGERALALAAVRDHANAPYDVFIDNGHTHVLSRVFPDLPVVNWYHDIFQPPARCAVLVSEGQRSLMNTAQRGMASGGVGWEDARVIHNLVSPPPNVYQEVVHAEPYAVFIGAVMNYKQPLLAIQSAARAGISLKFAGHGSQTLREIASGNENVEFLGAVHGAAKWDLLRNAQVMLQLGYAESFGLTTVEALLCGTPVVAWASGGSVDIITYGENGVFVPVGGRDKVGAVADSIVRCADISRPTARRSALRFAAITHPSQLADPDPDTAPDDALKRYQRDLESAIVDCANGAWW